MDLTSNKYLEPSTLFSSKGDAILESMNGLSKTSMKNPFLDSFPDPFCKVGEIRGFSEISSKNGVTITKRNFLEAPPTPGRPVFSFSNTTNSSRKCFPSKWDDAEKWLVSGSSSCNESPANKTLMEPSKMYNRHCSGYKPYMGDQIFAEKSRITEEKVSKVISNFHGPLLMGHQAHHHHHQQHTSARVALSAPADVLLKDKFPNKLNFGEQHLDPMQEKFLFGHTSQSSEQPQQQTDDIQVHHRDVGTEMTPLPSSTASRCPTPFKSTSPARHNTPADRSGPLGLNEPDENATDITQLQDCHLAKLHFGSQFDSITSNWSSREEEEEDVSKSLRHFEITSNECGKSVSESKNNCLWEEEEKNKSCLRYQREEAKIQAWVNLQSAKAEAESRKLEVKVQKMRANMEEKLMKRMADVHRKAEEWRATAQFQHLEQVRKAGQMAREAVTRTKNNSRFSGHESCGCFPCSNK
ncbi:hypothetical protein OROGR_005139 [Orobanche gracilis]